MSTKPPPAVSEFSEETLEKLAYSIVQDIETVEPNDRNRLGFNVWAWLKERKGTLKDAVHAAGARTTLDEQQLLALLERRLQEKGVRS